VKALVIDGFRETDGAPHRLHELLAKALETRRLEVKRVRPADHEIKWCNGEFNCWVKTPGICISDDMNTEITRSFVASDLVIYTTPNNVWGLFMEPGKGRRPPDSASRAVLCNSRRGSSPSKTLPGIAKVCCFWNAFRSKRQRGRDIPRTYQKECTEYATGRVCMWSNQRFVAS